MGWLREGQERGARIPQHPEAEGAWSWGARPWQGQGPPRAGLSSTGHSALLGQEKGLGVLPQLVPCPQHQRRHHEASHAELTFVERRVQEGVVEEQAPALSPALGLAPHHQLAVAGCLQTFRHKEREDRRVRPC